MVRRLRRYAPVVGAALLGTCLGAAVTAAHAGPSRESPYDIVRNLARVLVEIEGFYVDPVDRRKLLSGAVKGMVAELDAHSAYLPPDEWREFKDSSRGQFAGIGIEVDLRDDAITVIAPIEGSPAERAGIKSRDRIVAIDGEVVLDPATEKVIKRMRGEPGTRIKLTVRRPGVTTPMTFDLVREIVRVPSVRVRRFVDGIGYMRLSQFTEGCHAEFVQAATALRRGGELRGLVLDLRNNAGGLVDEAVAIADEILDSGGIYTTRHRGVVIDDVRAGRGGVFATLPLVVLVNEGSASASELLAGALQDDGRALIVGSQTFGKGSVQAIIELPSQSGLKLTIARYYTPLGRSIQVDGVTPDVIIAGKLNDPSLGPIRERDFGNHLPAEIRGPTRRPDAGVVHPPEDAGLDPVEFRAIPEDPRGGPDYGVEVAFEVLSRELAKRESESR